MAQLTGAPGGGGPHARELLRRALGAAFLDGQHGLAAADRLCRACVELLGVDGAAVSLVHEGATRGTFGSSGEMGRRLDEYQFTFGEGPCLDAVTGSRPQLVPDLGEAGDHRWPAFAAAMLNAGVQAVFALPVTVAGTAVGALDLFRRQPGALERGMLDGGLWAAQLAALPLLDLMTGDLDWADAAEGGDGWEQLASLERVEVYQATGMLVAQLDIAVAEALVRLRAHAFATGRTASEVAWAIVQRRLQLGADNVLPPRRRRPGPGSE